MLKLFIATDCVLFCHNTGIAFTKLSIYYVYSFKLVTRIFLNI